MIAGTQHDYRKRDFELLALARRNGLDAQTLARLEQTVRALQAVTGKGAPVIPARIDNLLRGSDFDHSFLSFTGAGSNTNVYPWFRGVNGLNPISTVGTNPLWILSEGWLEWSLTTMADDLSYRFDRRMIRPGQTLYLMFNARLKDTGVSGAGLSMEVGIWDATGGINNWITASLTSGPGSSTISVTKIGPGAPATTYTYVVVAITDQNEVIVSAPQSVLGAATLNTTDFNQISWQLTGGVLEYRIFRTTPNPGLIGIVASGASTFNDQGAPPLIPNAPIPQPSGSQARTTISNFGSFLSTKWQTIRTVFRVPRNYNFSLTAANGQWLRMGLRGVSTAIVEIDRVGLSLSPGAWQPSIEDRQAVGDFVITPVGDGLQGDVGFVDSSGVRLDVELPLLLV